MHSLKIVILVALTLAAMRASSWFLLWLLVRLSKRDSIWLRLTANVLALGVFVGLLVAESVPGELLDLSALVFGVVTFGACFGLDRWWLPRCLKPSPKQPQGPVSNSGTGHNG